MLSDDDAEKAVDFLRDNARKAAQATANREYLDEFKKVVRAQIMRENADKPIGTQEAIAQADARYVLHLKTLQDAIEHDEYMSWMMKAAEVKFDLWRTQSANVRKA